jgi:hypothetical protein
MQVGDKVIDSAPMSHRVLSQNFTEQLLGLLPAHAAPFDQPAYHPHEFDQRLAPSVPGLGALAGFYTGLSEVERHLGRAFIMIRLSALRSG